MPLSPARGRTAVTALAVALALFGCGGEDPVSPPPVPPPRLDDSPRNDTPANTMIRFERAFKYQVLDQYEFLFTADFRFRFSEQSDPALVSQYGDQWGKDDEIVSTSHLFDGFTNSGGDFVPGAADIALALPGIQFLPDPLRSAGPDSSAYYVLARVPSISLRLEVPGTDGYEIAAPHDFHLVRGDAAVLDASQQATADRWYLWRWDDKSAALGAGMPPTEAACEPRTRLLRIQPASPASWGRVKAAYHR